MRIEATFENGPREISWDGDVEALIAWERENVRVNEGVRDWLYSHLSSS